MKLENKDKFGNLIGKQRFFSITVAQNPDLSFTVTITPVPFRNNVMAFWESFRTYSYA